jgi:hypothetical protein
MRGDRQAIELLSRGMWGVAAHSNGEPFLPEVIKTRSVVGRRLRLVRPTD